MTTKTLRKIVKIDEEKCNGCGICLPSCAEGALQIINGKAKLISEKYCDGLGACLGDCPQGAITIEEREAEGFDEEAVEHHLESKEAATEALPCGCASEAGTEELPCGCSSATVTQFERRPEAEIPVTETGSASKPMLAHWPVQLTLVPPSAPFLREADLVLAADCVPFAYPDFHREFLKDHALVIACPKLDNFEAHLRKLTEILRQSEPKSLTIVHMEVPCCSGLVQMARQAIMASGKDIPLREITIGIKGDRQS
ncbi:MAG TPA: 4Fe-4S binding protein [Dehalococcoidales bacterium]|nr:4Fe-4S binding protein [Dehalococcoidales bacterium]